MQELLSKYGGEQHLVIPEELKPVNIDPDKEELNPSKLRIDSDFNPMAQATINSHIVVKTKYEEDVFENGHQSVWGSYWHPVFGWGYRCCYSFDKKVKCRGEEGRVETIKREYELQIKLNREKEEAERIRVEEENKKFKPLEEN